MDHSLIIIIYEIPSLHYPHGPLDRNDHTVRIPGKPGTHDFSYRAGWGVLRFGNYTHTTPTTRNRDGSLILNGAMALPAGLGTYKVKGKLTATTFDATYSSKHDSGSFTLRRP